MSPSRCKRRYRGVGQASSGPRLAAALAGGNRNVAQVDGLRGVHELDAVDGNLIFLELSRPFAETSIIVIVAFIVVAGLCLAAATWALTAERRATRLQALLEAERRTAADKLAEVERARESLKDTFAALSADALARNNQRFLDLAKEKLGEFQ